MHFRNHYFFYIILSLSILTGAASYYRFIVTHDYMVSYEGNCDPYTKNCYVGCEDDECTEKYFYTVVLRHAVDIEELCGYDITDCEAANSCSAIDRKCSVTYCDSNNDSDECDDITSEGDIKLDDF